MSESLLQSAIDELKQLRAKIENNKINDCEVDDVDEALKAIENGLKKELIEDNESNIWDVVAEHDLRNVCAYFLENDVGFERWGDNKSPMMIAAMAGNTEIVRMMLDHGWDPNEWTNIFEYTPLSLAASSGAEDVFFLLLEKGAKLHMVGYDYELTTDPAGERFDVTPETLLVDAIVGKNVNICRYLVEHIPDMKEWSSQRYMSQKLCDKSARDFCLNSGIPELATLFVPFWDAWHKR